MAKISNSIKAVWLGSAVILLAGWRYPVYIWGECGAPDSNNNYDVTCPLTAPAEGCTEEGVLAYCNAMIADLNNGQDPYCTEYFDDGRRCTNYYNNGQPDGSLTYCTFGGTPTGNPGC